MRVVAGEAGAPLPVQLNFHSLRGGLAQKTSAQKNHHPNFAQKSNDLPTLFKLMYFEKLTPEVQLVSYPTIFNIFLLFLSFNNSKQLV